MKPSVRVKALAGLSALLVAGPVSASFVPIFTGMSGGPNTTFSYDLVFATGGNPAVERLQSGDFVTIYDISGLISANPPTDFTVSTQNLGITAPNTTPSDDPALPNVTFSYTGPTITTDMTFAGSIVSSFSTTIVDNFTSQSTINTGPQAGTPFGQIGAVEVPGIPEPTAIMVLNASGLLLLRRRV